MPLRILCMVLPIVLFLGAIVDGNETRPNIILIMCDDLGWGDVGFNGNPTIQTPHLDRWAAQGVVLERFYAAAPVCSPTRGSCLTGRNPFRYGIYHANHGHLPPAEITLAEILAEAGYATGHFGKWHLGTLTTKLRDSNRGGPRGTEHFSPPWQHGFTKCFSTEAKVPTWDPMHKPANAGRQWWDPLGERPGVAYGTRYWSGDDTIVTENLDGDNSRVIMDRAIPFIRESVEGSEPFFAVIWFHSPHLPVVSGHDYTSAYPTSSKYEQHYFGCITALDVQVGRLRDELERLGVDQDTFVLFCSDNGPEGKARNAPGTAAPFRGRKRDLFEGGIRVPAFASWPRRLKAHRRIAAPLVTSDFLPTTLAILDQKPTDDRPLDGIDIMPLLVGQQNQRNIGIGFRFQKQSAWIEDRYKLLQRGNETLLFDLVDDPSEAKDLSTDRPDIVASLSKKLEQWTDSCHRSDQGADYSP